jgi:protocatechuate 3,4-dioxygenase beta subunit
VTSFHKRARFAIGTAAAAIVLGASLATSVLAQTLPAETIPVQTTDIQPPSQTPADASAGATNLTQTSDNLSLTVSETEGPYYKAGSPEASNLVQSDMQGQVITITGQVLDQNGNPVANAWLDYWQANASGAYDNSGYTLRGHQYTDANGSYTLTTVVPGLYPGRTEHIHVKVQAPNGPVLTTQLFFPGVAQNSRDSIYDPSLLLNVADTGDGTLSATYNFVVATA